MKQLLKTSLFILLFIVVCGIPSFADEYYDIENMDVRMVVSEDNIYDITETITVFFKQPRHGIFRNIPYKLYGYNHKIKDVRVIDPSTGKKITTELSRSDGDLVIRMGDEDTYVEGRMVYEISYTFYAGSDRNDESDELYWNLIGPEWDTMISTADFRIEMPFDFPEDDVFFYDGAMYNERNERVIWEVQGKVIRATIESALLSNEGVTIKINLDEGYYQNVSKPFNTGVMYVILAAFLIAALMAYRYRVSVSNRDRIIPILSFYPPDGLNSPELAYVYKEENVSNQDMASLIVYWASKGCIHIKEETSVDLLVFKSSLLVFTKLKELPATAPQYEKTLFAAFFRHGSNGVVTTKDLKEVFYQDLTRATSGVKNRFKNEREILENKYQTYVGLSAFLLILATTAAYGLFTYLINGWEGFWSAVIGVGITLIFFSLFMLFANYFNKIMRKGFIPTVLGLLIYAIMLVFLTIPVVILMSDTLPIMWSENPIALVMILLLHLFTYTQIIGTKVYTDYAVTTVSQVQGFREFIEKAKQDQLEMLFYQNPTYFYDILPYAMVLGLTGIWEKYVNSMTVEPPNWYDSHRGFHTGYLLSNINQTVSAATSSPSSSSSGGGSSGGGGGGGGGGSW